MDLPRLVFIGTCIITALAISFAAGLYSGFYRTPVVGFVGDVKGQIVESVNAITQTSFIRPDHFLQPARGAGAGVTVNARPDDGDLIFLSGFFEDGNELRLIRRDGSIVARWPVKFSALFPDPSHMPSRWRPATDWNIDLHGALIQRDGSVVFNFEYGGLVKLDRCGMTLWTLAHMTHHSVEQAEDGSFWVPSWRDVRSDVSPFPPFKTPYKEDLILHVSGDGRILSDISVPGILYENGLKPLLTATGEPFRPGFTWDRELVHLNKIAVLTSDLAASFPMFEAGDLMLSLRNMNLVMIYSPSTGRVKWWQIGPWLRQHDPEFNRDGTIAVFNNNAFMDGLSKGQRSDPSAPRTTNIMRIDPETRETQVAFGGRPGQEMLTFLRGKHEVTEDGGFLITEFEAGRVIETDASGNIVWEYINRYDDEHVAEVTEARLYLADYFTVTDWSCPAPAT